MALNPLVSVFGRLVAAENVVTDRQTDGRTYRPSTVTLAAHARRGLINSAMPRILGERERTHWLWPKCHMPCRAFYDSRSNTALNKLFTGGQHGRCIAYDSPLKTHSVVVVSCGDVHTESGSAGVDTVQAQGWSVVERKQRVC